MMFGPFYCGTADLCTYFYKRGLAGAEAGRPPLLHSAEQVHACGIRQEYPHVACRGGDARGGDRFRRAAGLRRGDMIRPSSSVEKRPPTASDQGTDRYIYSRRPRELERVSMRQLAQRRLSLCRCSAVPNAGGLDPRPARGAGAHGKACARPALPLGEYVEGKILSAGF
ncbi:MAG: hypothetical protein M0C28_16955 [Candidatus Moduliflexus flocculans]|nr:hypothetical protein [Candidatus Moduliflexus flocculans]